MLEIPNWFFGSALFCVTSIAVLAIAHQYDVSAENTPWGSFRLRPGRELVEQSQRTQLCEQQATAEDEQPCLLPATDR